MHSDKFNRYPRVMALCDLLCNVAGDMAFPLSSEKLGEVLGESKFVAHRLLDNMVKRGLLIREKASKGGRGAASTYRIATAAPVAVPSPAALAPIVSTAAAPIAVGPPSIGPVISPRDAGERMGVSPSTLVKKVDAKEILGYRFGSRVMISLAAIELLIAQGFGRKKKSD